MPSRMPGTQVKNMHLDKATSRVEIGSRKRTPRVGPPQYLAGVASKAAMTMADSQSNSVEIPVEAPYQIALQAGAIVLDEKPLGITYLLLTETADISVREVLQFARQPSNERYRKELQAYLSGTANLTRPRVVEYTASANDHLGRLYGRRPCAQRLPRKLRLLLFGRNHQEVDMIGSFYEIMRRLSNNQQLLCIAELRAVISDLLGLIPSDQRSGQTAPTHCNECRSKGGVCQN